MPTHREHVFKKLGLPLDAHVDLEELGGFFGVPLEVLHEVMKRGAGAWRSNLSSVRLEKDFSKNPDTRHYPRSARLSQSQWKWARVYSFLDHGKTWHTADHDLVIKYGLD